MSVEPQALGNRMLELVDRMVEARGMAMRDTADTDLPIELYSMKEEMKENKLTDHRVERFKETFRDGILYRPEIVEEIKGVILHDNNVCSGTMVKGPHGIGKSHSLVNLVRNLRREGHIVTFIPDCELWSTPFFLLEAIFRSFGVKPSDYGFGKDFVSCYAENLALRLVVDCITTALETVNEGVKNKEDGLHWFLVFNQVNRIFARAEHKGVKDVGVLPHPFNFMKLTDVFVHPVISASTNNNLAYRENHPNFAEYIHPIAMGREEVEKWKRVSCQGFSEEDWIALESATGLCPLQVSKYLTKKDGTSYVQESSNEVLQDLFLLEDEFDGKQRAQREIADNAVCCLLSLPFRDTTSKYDKKYSVAFSNGYLHYLRPLFPSVLHAYRTFFWKDVMAYVVKNERLLLHTCGDPRVTNDVRGRLFELIVISRFQNKTIVSNDPTTYVLPCRVDQGEPFDGQELPHPDEMQESSLFIPKNSNFPAIDLILKEGTAIWAIQVHVADHDNVEPKFREMCDRQQWFNHFDDIFLVYLSPSPEVTEQLTCLPATPSRVMHSRPAKRTKPEIQVSGLSIQDFECLKDLQWPLADYMEVGDA